jgi:hypothetical protein
LLHHLIFLIFRHLLLNNKNIVHFSAYKKHIGLYPGSSAIEHFKVLKNEDSVKEFFAKNREQLTSNMKKIKETTERRSREIKGVMDAYKGLERWGLFQR